MESNSTKTRRRFVNLLISGWTVLTAVPFVSTVLRYASPPGRRGPVTAAVATTGEIPPGSGSTVSLGNKPVLLISTPDGEYRAFLAHCTHLGCVVRYRDDRNDIFCACHRSVFDIEGNAVSGPAPRPLVRLPLTINNESILVTVS
jgi:cytochrome b6-f complex iron-sulfur subunit